jgi:cell division protein FtsZ
VNEACSIIREAAECEDAQINFGVILNESLADAVKITVIATGFQPEQAATTERRNGAVTKVRSLGAEPEPVPPPAVPLPEPSIAEPVPVGETALVADDGSMELDLDDLDTPAYMRQGRLLN